MSEAVDLVQASASWPDRTGETRRRLEAVARDVRELASAEGAAEELLRTLPGLGPVFSGFARFLSTRADVVPAGLRSDLATVSDRIEPVPISEVRSVVEAAWGRSLEDICVVFEEHPVETRFPTQSHRAWLTPTDAVIVTSVPPTFELQVERELALLPMLASALAESVGGTTQFDALVADYSGLVRRLMDMSADLTASEALVADARRFPPLRSRRPHPGLSSRRVAVWDDVAVVTPDTPGFDHEAAGPSVCRAWLRQALLGRTFPEEPAAADFIIAGRRQVAIGGRLFTTLPSATQLTLQGYLVATAAGDPDLAIKFLMRELTARRGVDAAGFQRRMRHAWSVDADAAGGSELLAQLLLHWRIAVDHGYEPKPGLVSFYRGCLAAVSAATALGAEPDVLRDTLEALQIRLVAFQIEALTGITPSAARTVREAGWRFITALASGPVALDRHGAGRSGLSMSAAISLLLMLTAIGFAAPALIASGLAWSEPIGASLFAAIGAAALLLITLRRQAS